MKVRTETITPERATYYLDLNVKNRPVTSSNVKHLVRLMQAGQWKSNGDAIRVSKSGVLLDGQHRLLATEIAGISYEAVIVEDLDDDVFNTIDTGRKRTAADALAVSGYPHYATLAAIARLFLLWKKQGDPTSFGQQGFRPSHQDIQRAVDTYPFLQDAASTVQNTVFLKKYLRGAYGGLAFAIIAERDIKAAHRFFGVLSSDTVQESNTIRLLRERLIAERGAKSQVSRAEILALVLKAFRAWRDGRELKQLRVQTQGVRKEADLYRAWPEETPSGNPHVLMLQESQRV